jgi:glycosyltransferase involved in cell wall biosynthesis
MEAILMRCCQLIFSRLVNNGYMFFPTLQDLYDEIKKQPEEVAEQMHKADALVLSSRYETYGVVLAEAVAAGLPILSTPVGIAEEVADLIVPQEIAQHKPGRFAEFLETILWNTDRFTDRIQNTDRFTAEAVGRKLVSIYGSCLHHDI